MRDEIECPGGNQTCATGYTCCLTPMGDYGCCPFTEGVCCEDHIHCCPKGSSCDTKSRRCVKKPTLLGPADGSDSNIICPGNTYQCPGKSTCCSMPNGRYGCCPLPNVKFHTVRRKIQTTNGPFSGNLLLRHAHLLPERLQM